MPGVSVRPGAKATVRMPWSASSRWATLARMFTPALVARRRSGRGSRTSGRSPRGSAGRDPPWPGSGRIQSLRDPSLAAEVLTAVYFDTLSRWLTEAEPPFDLSGGLADKLDLVLAGLTVPPPRKRT